VGTTFYFCGLLQWHPRYMNPSAARRVEAGLPTSPGARKVGIRKICAVSPSREETLESSREWERVDERRNEVFLLTLILFPSAARVSARYSSVPRARRRRWCSRFVMFTFFCKLISHREKIRRNENKMFRQNSNRERPTQFHSSFSVSLTKWKHREKQKWDFFYKFTLR